MIFLTGSRRVDVGRDEFTREGNPSSQKWKGAKPVTGDSAERQSLKEGGWGAAVIGKKGTINHPGHMKASFGGKAFKGGGSPEGGGSSQKRERENDRKD